MSTRYGERLAEHSQCNQKRLQAGVLQTLDKTRAFVVAIGGLAAATAPASLRGMTPRLTPAQEDLLIALVVADRTARARTGESDRFAWHRSGGMGPTELLHRGAEPGQTIDGGDMEALIGCGLLERTGQRAAVLTPDAARLGLRLERARGVQVPVEVTWAGAEPVLQALWDLWASLGAPPLGAPLEEIAAELDDEPARVERLLELLEENGWAQLRAEGDPRSGTSATYAPTSRAMERFGGWPAPEDGALHRFLAAIDAAVEESDDEEEKGRLRGLRDAAQRVGEGTLTAVLGRLATGQLPL